MTALRLAIFDCDGTLVDSQHAIVGAMTTACEAAGLCPPAAAAVRRVVGLPLEHAIARLLPGIPATRHQVVADLYRKAFSLQRRQPDYVEPLFPGVAAALEALEAAGVLLGIATGKSRRGLIATLERHGLRHRFLTLQTSDDGPGKPLPDMVLRALAETGVDADSAVVIGDTTYDIEMARRARVGAIGVAWGYHDAAELVAAGAERIVGRFADVPGAVLACLEARRPAVVSPQTEGA